MKRIFAGLLVLGFWHSSVSAEAYYWVNMHGNGSFSNPLDACRNTHSIVQSVVIFNGGLSAGCQVPGGTLGTVYRMGDSCEAGSEFDSEIGECVEPPKQCVEGELFPARGASSPIQTSDAGSWVPSVPPSGMCYQSCSYAGVQGETRSTGCYKDPADETMGYCNYIIKGTGESCSTESYEIAVSGEPLNSPPPADDPPPTICPPGWGLSGNTCFKLPPKPCDPSTGEICGPPGDGDGDGDGDGKGDGDGDTGGGGGGGGGGDGGSGDGGDSGSGGGSGSDSGSGGSPGKGEGDGLFEPKAGSFDGYIEDADKAITDSKKKLKEIADKYKGLIDSKLAIHLSTAGGGLPCWSFSFYGSSQQVCLSQYEQEAAALRNVLLLLAAIAALFIIFSRRSD